MHCKCHKVNLKRGGLDSPDWLKNEKGTINPINDAYECLSIRCNRSIESWKNKKIIAKIIENIVFYISGK